MSNIEEAERRIQENKQNSDPFLELNNLSLREIPDATFQLTHLRKLSLTNNALEKLDKRLLELHDLKVLGLNYNKLTILPPWIGEMKFLRSLDCWNTKQPPAKVQFLRYERSSQRPHCPSSYLYGSLIE